MGGRVHFFCDIPGWAFDNVVSLWIPELAKHRRQATKSFRNEFPDDFVAVEVLLPMWWPFVETLAEKKLPHQRMLCRIPDFASWNENAPPAWQERFLRIAQHVDLFVATSKQIGQRLCEMNLPNVVVGDCVDPKRFAPQPVSELRELRERPVIGWAGNPKSLNWLKIHDAKGFEVVKSLSSDPFVNLHIASSIPHDEIPGWYTDIDILLCASRLEGTPLPVLEAMSCGKPVISTPVGVVPELLPLTSGIEIFDGTAEGLRLAVENLCARKNEWKAMGMENREAVIRYRSPSVTAMRLATLCL